MNQAQIERALDSIGKAVFVKYFTEFRQCARMNDNATCVEKLQDVGYSEKARRTRCSKAKAIFNANKECVALNICAHAKIPHAVQKKAEALYKKHCA